MVDKLGEFAVLMTCEEYVRMGLQENGVHHVVPCDGYLKVRFLAAAIICKTRVWQAWVICKTFGQQARALVHWGWKVWTQREDVDTVAG